MYLAQPLGADLSEPRSQLLAKTAVGPGRVLELGFSTLSGGHGVGGYLCGAGHEL